MAVVRNPARILLLVEGQSEERFIKNILLPHLRPRGIEPIPTLLKTKIVLEGPNHKGGIGTKHFERDLQRLLRDSAAAMITMMVDLYGLPSDFPGMDAVRTEKNYRKRVTGLTVALKQRFVDERFLPYFSTHEFEALILGFPLEIAHAVGLSAKAVDALVPQDIEIESVNLHNPPARRIAQAFQGYRKALHGPTVAERVGLAEIRLRCSFFDAWIKAMEEL